jgi:hypothetical protein
VFTLTDLETRLAVGRSSLRLAAEASDRFPGFSRSVFVTRSHQVVIEFGLFGGDEGTLRIRAEFSTRLEALMQGLAAARREPESLERTVVVDPDWLPDCPNDADIATSEWSLRQALVVRDRELFPSASYAVVPDAYWTASSDRSK